MHQLASYINYIASYLLSSYNMNMYLYLAGGLQIIWIQGYIKNKAVAM